MLINCIKTFPDFFEWCYKLELLLPNKYVFRGQPSGTLTSSFERAIKKVSCNNWGDIEQKIILEFKRRAHHYLLNIPKDDSHLEWLALMQHYGCPTRLLDFTKSFFIGLFFAIDGADSNTVLWAVDTTKFKKMTIFKEHLLSSYNEESEKKVNELLGHAAEKEDEPNIILVEPFRMNERISIQQGAFLFPMNLYKSFEENIFTPLGGVNNYEDFEKQQKNDISLLKIIIPKELHTEIAYWLSAMNITAKTLFPGLEGFARSQITHIKSAEYGEKKIRAILVEAFKQFANKESSNVK